MNKPARLASISMILNILSLLVYSFAISNVASQKFVLATEILSLMGVINLALSIVALVRSLRNEAHQHVQKIAWGSLAVAIGMMLVIGILLLNIWVYTA